MPGENETALPPTRRDVSIYFSQKGMPDCEAENFFNFYQERKWFTRKGVRVTKWKAFALRWIAAVVHDQPALFNRHVH